MHPSREIHHQSATIAQSQKGMPEMEIWKPVEGFSNYEVSNHGRIKNISTNHVLKQMKTEKGYLRVHLREGGKGRNFRVSRLVAIAFITKGNKKDQVNHIDGNKTNNHVDNLEWVTGKENINHAIRTGLLERKKVKVAQFDKSGNLINSFDSILQAANFINGDRGHIRRVCQGKWKTHKGFVWRFV